MELNKAIKLSEQFNQEIGKKFRHKSDDLIWTLTHITVVPTTDADFASLNWHDLNNEEYRTFLLGKDCELRFLFNFKTRAEANGPICDEEQFEKDFEPLNS